MSLALVNFEFPAEWILFMRFVGIGFHLYMVLFIRLWHLPNWNTLCMAMASVGLSGSPSSETSHLLLGGLFCIWLFGLAKREFSWSIVSSILLFWVLEPEMSIYSAVVTSLFVVLPIMAYFGFGFGYFSHHYFCGGFEGTCRLIYRKDRLPLHILQHCLQRVKEYPEDQSEFLTHLTTEEVEDLAHRLGLNDHRGRAYDLLLQQTVLLDTSYYEKFLALTRPMCNETFCTDLDVFHIWFWKWYNQTFVRDANALLVVVSHWTWKGYKNYIIPLEE
jgi:hypothetical protein